VTRSRRRAVGTAIGLGLLGGILGLAVGSAASLNLVSQPLTPYRTCTVSATPSTTTVVIDASVRQGAPGSNFGSITTNNVASGSGANRRLYVKFDLAGCAPAIPATATIRLATLRLYVTGLPAVCRTIDMFRVTAAWTEAAITWTNQPFGATINNPASAAATDTFGVGTPVGCENRATGTYLVGANPTADVTAWVAGTATNHGWMLRDDVEGSATARTETLSAKDLNTLAQTPQLVVTYVEQP
jgi:hypothetical protein